MSNEEIKLPLELVDIISQGHEGWANLIYTGEDCPGLPVAMLPPFFVPLFRRILAARPVADAVDAVGEASNMPGTTGFTMACFKADAVPVGTKLYRAAPSARTIDNDTARRVYREWQHAGESEAYLFRRFLAASKPVEAPSVRDQALEEAAQQCEDIYSWEGAYSAGTFSNTSLKACAAAIRALQGKPEAPPTGDTP